MHQFYLLTVCICSTLRYYVVVNIDHVSKTYFFFFKQKTAYEMRISDWSSDVCSSDLQGDVGVRLGGALERFLHRPAGGVVDMDDAAVAEIGRASCRERVCQYV